MSTKSGTQTVTQTLPPAVMQTLTQLSQQAGNLARGTTQGGDKKTSIVAPLSDTTLAGIDALTQGIPGVTTDLLTGTAAGDYLNSNPYANASAGIAGVQDAITAAAQKAVGDQFSQAGRTGSPSQGFTLGSTVARELAPYAFGAQENALNRGFSGYENERARQLNAALQLPALQSAHGQQLLGAGNILDQQKQQQLLEPFTRAQMGFAPFLAALGGAPTTTSTPLTSNTGAGILGGLSTGAGLGTALGLSNPWTAGLAIGGGLLGGFI